MTLLKAKGLLKQMCNVFFKRQSECKLEFGAKRMINFYFVCKCANASNLKSRIALEAKKF